MNKHLIALAVLITLTRPEGGKVVVNCDKINYFEFNGLETYLFFDKDSTAVVESPDEIMKKCGIAASKRRK